MPVNSARQSLQNNPSLLPMLKLLLPQPIAHLLKIRLEVRIRWEVRGLHLIDINIGHQHSVAYRIRTGEHLLERQRT